jgi:hypothetical protein
MLAVTLSISVFACAGPAERGTVADAGWVRDFGLESRTLETSGDSRYCILKPGYQIVLESDDAKVAITVLDETRRVDGVETRVVEEREEERGKVVEVSRNFLAIDTQTGDVFYFGEEVDNYKNGKLTGHSGAWLAGENGAKAGLLIPGRPMVGHKHYQEIAPGKAMDRAEVISVSETFKTPGGTFENCLKTMESSGLNPSERELKRYAPGIGQIQDEDLLLTSYGYAD